VGKCHEDVFWSWQAVARAKKVSIFDTPCYFYLQRSGSIMGQQFSEKRLDSIEAKCIRQVFLEQNYPALAGTALCSLHFSCIYLGQRALLSLPDERLKPVLADLSEVMARHPIRPAVRNAQPVSHRVWLLLASRSLKRTCRLRNRLKIGL
jgi:hypothetical protein